MVTLIVLTPVLALGAPWFAVPQLMLPDVRKGTFAATVVLLADGRLQELVLP